MLLPAEMVAARSKIILLLLKSKGKWFVKLEIKYCIFLKFQIPHSSFGKK